MLCLFIIVKYIYIKSPKSQSKRHRNLLKEPGHIFLRRGCTHRENRKASYAKSINIRFVVGVDVLYMWWFLHGTTQACKYMPPANPLFPAGCLLKFQCLAAGRHPEAPNPASPASTSTVFEAKNIQPNAPSYHTKALKTGQQLCELPSVFWGPSLKTSED